MTIEWNPHNARMMDRCKVIAHMYVSIDGKYMDESGCDISGEYYDDIIDSLGGDSMAGGRITDVMIQNMPNI